MFLIPNNNSAKNVGLQNAAQEKLMRVVPFTDADLQVNDDGFFSADQQKRLKPKTDLYIALSAIGAFMGFVTALVCFYVGQNSDSSLLATGLSLTIFGVCFYGIFWSLSLAKQIKRGIGVKKAEGAVELFIKYSGKHGDIPNYFLKIQGLQFHLSQTLYDAFATGEYRIYYFRLLRNEILSVEPIN